MIHTRLTRKIFFQPIDVEFHLKEDDFTDIKKAISILRLPEIAVIGDGSTIALEVLDSKNPTGDVYAVELGETEEKFNFIFREENIKINPGDYKVQIHWGAKKLVSIYRAGLRILHRHRRNFDLREREE